MGKSNDNSPFTFLVTTDNHLGFKDDDHLRRKDSFLAFGEALKIARERDVDFILLGGDLFHYNRPSGVVEHKCIKLIRQHISAEQGGSQKSVRFQRIAGDFCHFKKLNHPNFEDTQMNVSRPILTIHGNHDNPTGSKAKSICEKLATCGLLNYFGAFESSQESECRIHIKPIVLQKGHVKLALYGLGFIPDLKLKTSIERGEVTYEEPPEDTYNILIVHQNRLPLVKNKCLPDVCFPKFFHLIIRGHEHQTQKPEPLENSDVDGLVYQPGSTVATSISVMEAGAKKVGLFRITEKDPDADPKTRFEAKHELIELTCCRPMLFKDVSQKELYLQVKKIASTSRVTPIEFRAHSQKYIEKCIEDLIEANRSKRSEVEDREKRFDLPLVRIRIEYTSKNQRFDELDVSNKFYPSKVANRDIVLFKKQKLEIGDGDKPENVTFLDDADDADDIEEFDHIDLDEERKDTIDQMIESYFQGKPAHEQLKALSIVEYTNAVKGSNDEGNIISKVLSRKKLSVMNNFNIETVSEEDSMKFHDQSTVEKWFLASFKSQTLNKVVQDDDDVLFDDELFDDDVMICN